ncbi:hypothetical protein BDW22DRAFT_1324131 [Trametopsis cervina]|nr:hypothetical protein BDW22DRAFT_1324131 [Trametopsis cervina]
MHANGFEYKLQGMIYFGSFHFTARIVDEKGDVWYHDGVQTGRDCNFEGNMNDIDVNSLLQAKNGRKCSTVLYTLI